MYLSHHKFVGYSLIGSKTIFLQRRYGGIILDLWEIRTQSIAIRYFILIQMRFTSIYLKFASDVLSLIVKTANRLSLSLWESAGESVDEWTNDRRATNRLFLVFPRWRIFPSRYFPCLTANEEEHVLQKFICTYIAAVIILYRAIDLAQRVGSARPRRNCSSVDATSRRPWHVVPSSFILLKLTSTDLRYTQCQISLLSRPQPRLYLSGLLKCRACRSL